MVTRLFQKKVFRAEDVAHCYSACLQCMGPGFDPSTAETKKQKIKKERYLT
jgi:hypothetical protein